MILIVINISHTATTLFYIIYQCIIEHASYTLQTGYTSHVPRITVSLTGLKYIIQYWLHIFFIRETFHELTYIVSQLRIYH